MNGSSFVSIWLVCKKVATSHLHEEKETRKNAEDNDDDENDWEEGDNEDGDRDIGDNDRQEEDDDD